jgi:HEAT repeat protein
MHVAASDAALRDIAFTREATGALPAIVRLSALRLRAGRLDPTDALMALADNAQPPSSLPGDDTTLLAARALAALPHVAFARALSMLQQNGQPQLRVGVLRAIGLRGDPRWAHLILTTLRATRAVSTDARIAAIDAAARLRLVEASDALIELARTPDGNVAVRRAAVRSLGALGGAFDPLQLRVLTADPATRGAALDALGALGDHDALLVVRALLDAPWAADRLAAAETLARLGHRDAIVPLRARLSIEDDRDVRRALWRALAQLGALDTLTHDDPLARWALAEALLRDTNASAPVFDPSRAAPDLIIRALVAHTVDLTHCRSDHADTRVACAMALGYGGSDAARRVDVLLDLATRDNDDGVRVAAVVSLERLAAHAHTSDETRGAACNALVGIFVRAPHLDTPESIAALSSIAALRIAVVRDEAARALSTATSPLARRVALYAVASLRATGAAITVERILATDEDAAVRGAAAHALAALYGRAADDMLATAAATANTVHLADQIARARSLAERASDGAEGDAVFRAGGAAPRSLWTLTRPDGRVLFAVAAGDGELFIPDVWRAEPGELAALD